MFYLDSKWEKLYCFFMSCLRTLCLALLGVLHLHAIEVTCSQTQAVYYAGLENQALMRVCIKGGEGKSLSMIGFTLKGSTHPKSISKATLYTSGNTPYFSLNDEESRRAKPVLSPVNSPGTKMILFKGDIPLAPTGDTYLWLVADVVPSAPGGSKIDAECAGLKLGAETIKPQNPAPTGAGEVYPFKYRIVPYYRCENLIEWRPDLLQSAHFKAITDLIYFSIGCDADGNITGGDNKTLIAGLAKLKKLRGKENVAIILGIAHSSPGLKATCASPEKRAKFAQQLYDYMKEHGYDGVDFDWEYPETAQDWQNFAILLSDVKPLMFELGATVSAAYTAYYKMATPSVFDQFDWSNTMSYDRGGEHSTFAQMTEDIDRCIKAGIPPCKIVPGLPFYSCEVDQRDWNEQKGFSYIVENFPSMPDSQNTFEDPKTKKKHYFNGPKLIEDKAKHVMKNQLGGVMIWGYDTDVDIKHPRSLARTLMGVMRPQKR